MKTKNEWLKIARRGALIALSACCVVALSGCLHDDDDDLPSVPYLWEISWTGDDSDVSPITIPLQWGDLNEITNFQDSFGDYTVKITKDGDQIIVEIWDYVGDVFNFYAAGTIRTATTADGNYTGTSSSGNPIQGTWMVVRQ